MLIRKIILKNFRQYYDENIIFLSTDEEKNVSVIRGENGVGKTAMLNSIKWALFGTFTSNFMHSNDLINNTARQNGITACSVEIEFEEDNQVFHLIRRFDKNNNKTELKIFKINDGVFSASLPEPELVINGMLPREMGEYFFFQGEGSNAVVTGNASGDITQAILDIMGFKVANKLIVSIKKALSDNIKLIASKDTSGKSTQLNTEREKIESWISQIVKKTSEINTRLPVLLKDREDTEYELQQFSNVDLRSLRQEESDTKAQIKKKKIELDELKKRRFHLIYKYGYAVFGQKFANKSQDFIDENELKGKLPEPYNKTFIEELLSKQECICGACLQAGTTAYQSVMSLLNKASNPQLTQRLNGIRIQVGRINTLCDGALDEISSVNKYYNNADEEIVLLQRRLEGINDKISQIPEQKIVELQRLRNKLDNEIRICYEEKGNYEGNLLRYESKKDSVIKEINSLVGATSIITDLKIKEEFLEKILEYVEGHLSKTEKNVRFHVLEKVNDTLKKFAKGDFKIKVEPDSFRIHLLDKYDNKVGQGDGLNLLLNLTITASLIHFAASQKKIKDPILSSATVAPLVIDAPFGVLDTSYRQVVVQLLPEYARQVIFLVSSSQWTEDMDNIIRDKIGKEYVLIMEESCEQGDKTIDVITAGNVKITSSRYGCEVDRTVIEEVKQ